MERLCFLAVFWGALLALFVLGSTSSSGVRCISSENERGKCVLAQQSCPANSSDSCIAQRADPAAAYDPSHAESRQACRSQQSNSPSQALAKNLTVMLYPVANKTYSLYVSWQTSDDSSTTGFRIGTYKCTGNCLSTYERDPPYYQKHQFECLQIRDPNVRRVLYNGVQHRTGLLECKDGRRYDPPRCNSSSNMTIVVMPTPVPGNIPFSKYLQSSSISLLWTNLDKCWITAYNAECSSPVFIKPVSNFTVEPVGAGGGFMSICISWLPSQGNVEYIVTVTDPLVTVVPNCTSPGQNPPCFLARNTSRVMVEGLNASREYSISVQVVPRCGNFSFAQHYIGCRSEACCRAQRVSALVPTYEVNETASTSAHHFPPSSSWFSPQARGSSPCHVVGSSYSPTRSILVATTISASVAMPTSSSTNTALQLTTAITLQSDTPVSSLSLHGTTPPYSRAEMNSLIGASSSTVIDEGSTIVGPLVGGLVTLVTVSIIILVAIPVVITLVLRRGRSQAVLSPSSNGSVESSTEGGDYCDLIISHDVSPGYTAITCSGIVHSESQLSENGNSQGTFEMGGSQEGSIASSCSEKLGSTCMDNNAFETLKAEEQTDFVEAENTLTFGRKVEVRTAKTNGRTQSESEYIPTSTLPSKKRPRSFSTPYALPSCELWSKKPPCALILYSHGTPTEIQQVIRELLVKKLREYNVRTVSEDTDPHREGMAAWLEVQMKEASAVFCVCNEAFRDEWEDDAPGISCIVPVFKQLLHGLVSHPHGENQRLLDKLAIVLPYERDIEHVPVYLNNRQKFGLCREDLDKMAKFTSGVPSYHVNSK